MRFSESLDFLNTFLNLERFALRPDNRVWNLDRMRFLLSLFGNPEKACRRVVIAGTKGKGSTGYIIESILQAACRRCGFYTSPHLETPLERIRIGGRRISRALWCRVFSEIRRGLKKGIPARFGEITYFEIMTLAAALAFRHAKADTAVFEAGLGGRLDAANALDASLLVMTSIAFDHEEFLGHTLAKIAGEKAGLIARKGLVISTRQKPEAMKVIQNIAKKRGARVTVTAAHTKIKTGLQGAHQQVNAGMALEACRVLAAEAGFRLSDAAIRQGLQARSWPGRFEILRGPRTVVLDVAHNPASMEAFVKTAEDGLKKAKLRPGAVIFGVTKDKRRGEMLAALSRLFPVLIPVTLPTNRSVEAAVLLNEARGLFETVMAAASIEEAFRIASAMTGKKDTIAVTGSFYLVGPVRTLLKTMKGYHVAE